MNKLGISKDFSPENGIRKVSSAARYEPYIVRIPERIFVKVKIESISAALVETNLQLSQMLKWCNYYVV